MTVVPIRPGGHEQPAVEPGAVRRALERVDPLPDRQRVVAVAGWWATVGGHKLAALIVRSPKLLLCELRPVAVGFGRVVEHWARWCQATELASRLDRAEQHHEKHAVEVERRKEGRRRASAFLLLLVTGAVWVAAVRWPAVLLVAVGALVLVCDAVGRKAREAPASVPAPARTVLKEGVPLVQITRTLVEVAKRESLELGVARAMTYDAARQEYRLTVTCLDAIEAKHLRAFERGIGAADHSIRCLATTDATTRELAIRNGDPLARVPQPEWIDTATIVRPLTLGVSVTEVPFALTFAGVHTAIIGRTGSGKTKGLLWTVIDRLLACDDVVLYGIDLAGGPALPMWRGCIQQAAYNPEDAAAVLDAACAELDRRMDVLRELAENDDPDDDQDEWASNLGPALVVVIDEFALVAEQNGEKGKLDLMGRVEKILRLGRKCWVTLALATQKAGNSDLGSTVAAAQIGVKILMSCTERDTTMMLGTEMRDAGWAPHLLRPATAGAVRDAGKAYVYGPGHYSPDVYRSFAPMTPGEVKRRARRRVEEGLPRLGGQPVAVDAVEVPPVLADVEQAFADAGNPDRMSTADLLAWLRAAGHDMDERALAEQLRPVGLRPAARWRPAPGANSIRGYNRAEVTDALRRLG